jgi:hypothetical protein
MAKNQAAETNNSEIETRLFASFLSLGRIGKSTLSQALITWAGYAGIPVAAIDADEEHRTLHKWYGDSAPLFPFRQKEDLMPIIGAAGNNPLEVLDCPAQATDAFLAAMEDFNGLAALAHRKVRLTVALFASDDRVALLATQKIILTLGDEVDYLIVKNPARYKSETFDKSTIPGLIPNARTITIPAITGYTMQAVDTAVKAQRKALTFGEALEFVPIECRMELEAWLNKMFCQFEDAADVLVPSADLIQNRVHRTPQAAKKVFASEFDL